MFGQQQSTAAFGASTQNAFGQSAFGSGGSSLFGSNSQKPLFGSTAATTTSTANQGSIFGSSFGTGAASATPTNQGTTAPFNPPTSTDYVHRSGQSTQVNTKYMCYTAMKDYTSKSIEELRLEDYVANRKGPTGKSGLFGTQSNTFGASSAAATTTQNNFLFGGMGANNTASFGQGQTSNQSSLFGNKSIFGSSATTTQSTGLFGSSNTSTPSTGFGFGQQSQCMFNLIIFLASVFGQKSVFGSTNASTGLFGSNQTTTTNASSGFSFGSTSSPSGGNLFGAQNNAQKPTSLFGSTAQKPLGFGTQPQQNSLFGAKPAESSAGGMFGGNQSSASGFSFGANKSTGGSLFGSTTTTTNSGFSFGNQQSTNLFGSNATQNKPLFGGATNTAQSSSGFSFGNAQTSNTAGQGLFGNNKPTGLGTGLNFGANQGSSTTGGFGFGASTANTGGSLFGKIGGNTTTQSSLGFGSNTGGSLFGNNLNTGMGANKPLGFGLNTGTTNNLGLGGQNTTGMGIATNPVDQMSENVRAQQHVLDLVRSMPYGQSNLFRHVFADESGRAAAGTKASEAGDQSGVRFAGDSKNSKSNCSPATKSAAHALAALHRGSTNNATGIRRRVQSKYLQPSNRNKLFTGFDEEDSIGNGNLQYSQSMNASGNISSMSAMNMGNSPYGAQRSSQNKFFVRKDDWMRLNISDGLRNSMIERSALESKIKTEQEDSELIEGEENNYECRQPVELTEMTEFNDENRPQRNVSQGIPLTASPLLAAKDSTTSIDSCKTKTVSQAELKKCHSALSPSSVTEEGLSTLHQEEDDEKTSAGPSGVKLTKSDYYTLPTLEELDELVNDDGRCLVEDFVIGRRSYGRILFPGMTDLTNLNLDDIVHFRRSEIVVYPDDSNKPPLGLGLNKAAEVTLDNIWPRDKSTKSYITCPDRLRATGFEKKLEKATIKMDAKFLEYRPDTGTWIFEVKHFSKYGFEDDDDEDDNTSAETKTSIPVIKPSVNNIEKSMEVGIDNLDKQKTGKMKQLKFHSLFETIDEDDKLGSSKNYPMDADMKNTSAVDYPKPVHFGSRESAPRKVLRASLFGGDEEDDGFRDSDIFSREVYKSSDKLIEEALQSREPIMNQMKSEPKEFVDEMSFDISYSSDEDEDFNFGFGPVGKQSKISEVKEERILTSRVENNSCIIHMVPEGVINSAFDDPFASFAELEDIIGGGQKKDLSSIDYCLDAGLWNKQSFKASFGGFLGNIDSEENNYSGVVLSMDNGYSLKMNTMPILIQTTDEELLNAALFSSESVLDVENEVTLDLEEQGSPLYRPSSNGHVCLQSYLNVFENAQQELIDCKMEDFDSSGDDHLVTKFKRGRMYQLFDLCRALWKTFSVSSNDSIGSATNLNEVNCEELHSLNPFMYNVARKQSVSMWIRSHMKKWLHKRLEYFEVESILSVNSSAKQKTLFPRISLKKSSQYEAILCCMLAGEIELACRLAMALSMPFIATMLSQASSGDPLMKRLMQSQLNFWHQSGSDVHIPLELLKIYGLIAGVVKLPMPSNVPNKTHLHVLEGYSWLNCFGAHLWYICGYNASLKDCINAYNSAWTSSNGFVAPPRPPTVEEFSNDNFISSGYQDTVILQDSSWPRDTAYHLLCLHSDPTYRLSRVLDPAGIRNDKSHELSISKSALLDWMPVWHIWRCVEAQGVSTLDDLRVSRLHAEAADQLIRADLWEWAVFVISHQAQCSTRYQAVKNLFNCHARVVKRNKKFERKPTPPGLTNAESFVIDRLHMPSQWLHLAKARLINYVLKTTFGDGLDSGPNCDIADRYDKMPASYYDLSALEVNHWIASGQYEKAHTTCMQRLMFDTLLLHSGCIKNAMLKPQQTELIAQMMHQLLSPFADLPITQMPSDFHFGLGVFLAFSAVLLITGKIINGADNHCVDPSEKSLAISTLRLELSKLCERLQFMPSDKLKYRVVKGEMSILCSRLLTTFVLGNTVTTKENADPVAHNALLQQSIDNLENIKRTMNEAHLPLEYQIETLRNMSHFSLCKVPQIDD